MTAHYQPLLPYVVWFVLDSGMNTGFIWKNKEQAAQELMVKIHELSPAHAIFLYNASGKTLNAKGPTVLGPDPWDKRHQVATIVGKDLCQAINYARSYRRPEDSYMLRIKNNHCRKFVADFEQAIMRYEGVIE